MLNTASWPIATYGSSMMRDRLAGPVRRVSMRRLAQPAAGSSPASDNKPKCSRVVASSTRSLRSAGPQAP